MKFRILHFRVGIWDAQITVVDVESPSLQLTLVVPTHKVLTEEDLAKLVLEAKERDREAMANLDMALQAHRTGRVLEA